MYSTDPRRGSFRGRCVVGSRPSPLSPLHIRLSLQLNVRIYLHAQIVEGGTHLFPRSCPSLQMRSPLRLISGIMHDKKMRYRKIQYGEGDRGRGTTPYESHFAPHPQPAIPPSHTNQDIPDFLHGDSICLYLSRGA